MHFSSYYLQGLPDILEGMANNALIINVSNPH